MHARIPIPPLGRTSSKSPISKTANAKSGIRESELYSCLNPTGRHHPSKQGSAVPFRSTSSCHQPPLSLRSRALDHVLEFFRILGCLRFEGCDNESRIAPKGTRITATKNNFQIHSAGNTSLRTKAKTIVPPRVPKATQVRAPIYEPRSTFTVRWPRLSHDMLRRFFQRVRKRGSHAATKK